MPQPIYTLSWILPIVRRGVKARSNFDYAMYLQQLGGELHRLQLEGVVKEPLDRQQMLRQVYDWNQAPNELYSAAIEAFFYLFIRGYIVPLSSNDQHHRLDLYRYTVTERGLEWFSGGDPLPEDAAGYMKFLQDRVPNMDAVIKQYVGEALVAFERQAYFAAAVMLGAASEKALYILAEAMVDALKSPKAKQTLEQYLKGRTLNPLFTFIRDAFERNRRTPNIPYDGAIPHLMSMFEAVRTQRNDAVHPTTGQVSADSVRLLMASFPFTLSKSEELRAWLVANPHSLD